MIDLDNNGVNTAYLAPVYMGSQGTEMMCIWDTGSDVGYSKLLCYRCSLSCLLTAQTVRARTSTLLFPRIQSNWVLPNSRETMVPGPLKDTVIKMPSMLTRPRPRVGLTWSIS